MKAVRVAHLVAHLAPAEALTNDALALAAQSAARCPTSFFSAGPVHPGLATHVASGLPEPGGRVLVHVAAHRDSGASDFDGDVSAALRASTAGAASIVVRLHGPPSPDPASSALLRSCDLALAVSSWVADRASALGARHVRVVPPLMPLDDHVAASSQSRPLSGAITTVGPFRSDAGLAHLVVVDHLVRTHFDPRVHLRAVGRIDDEGVDRSVRVLCDDLRLGNPFAGLLGHPEYVRALAASDVLLHHTRSSAFGVALVEAMAAGTPVIALDSGASAETVGDAGIVLGPDADATVWAEAVHVVRNDPRLRRQMMEAGTGRAAELAPARSAAAFVEALASIGWW